MRTLSKSSGIRQSGFTLIELVVVIVIIGILAAVAIPNLGTAADDARLAKQQATLGALKTAWSIVYSNTKTAPTCTLVSAAMNDPACTGTAAITCTGVTNKAGTAPASFTCDTATIGAGPSALTCAVAGC